MLVQVLLVLLAVTAGLVLALAANPRWLERRLGKIVAFLALFIFPTLALALGTGTHLEHAKSTEFCLSCHVMEPYGESLWIDDSDYLPASHFQNSRVPREKACYACHSDYTMFGGVEAKMKGLQHLWVYYFGDRPEPGEIELYEPYSNSVCLHCHGEARMFLENDFHSEFIEEIRSGETSCLECHDLTHSVGELGELERWQPPKEEGGEV